MVNLSDLVKRRTMMNFHRVIETKDVNLVKEMLKNNQQLIHPTYRNLDILTIDIIAQFFIKYGYLLKKFNPLCELLRSKNIPHELKDEEEIELLLHVINFNIEDDNTFEDPLIVAVRYGHLKWVELLLKNGARFRGDFFFSKSNEWPIIKVIFYVAKSKAAEVLQLVLKYYTNIDKTKILLSLSQQRYLNSEALIKMATILIQAGANVNGENDQDFPLFNALRTHRYDLALFLVDNGADVNKRCFLDNGDHCNLLFSAINFFSDSEDDSRLNLVKIMIEKGADLDYKRDSGATVLHHACEYKMVDYIPFLIEKGANISLTNSREKTPFEIFMRKAMENNAYYYHRDNNFLNKLNKVKICFVKEIARVKFENRKVMSSDLNIIRNNPNLSEFFKKCNDQLLELKSTMFYPPYTFADVLSMRNKNIRKLANLLKNEDFALNLEANLSLKNPDDLYYEDLNRILKEAKIVKMKYHEFELTLKSALSKKMPADVIKLIIDFIRPQDLP